MCPLPEPLRGEPGEYGEGLRGGEPLVGARDFLAGCGYEVGGFPGDPAGFTKIVPLPPVCPVF